MIDLDDLSVSYEKLLKIYKIRSQCQAICTWFLDEKGSIRLCSEALCIPKSTIHTYIHTYIRSYFNEEYVQIMNILKYNKKYRTTPHKYWKGRPW